jgi:hypothetical protein
MAASRKRGGRPLGDTIGGILVGFDQQILRNQPPPQELVRRAAPVRGVSGEDGSEFLVVFPGDEPDEDDAAEAGSAEIRDDDAPPEGPPPGQAG